MSWLDLLGWFGSALLVVSLLQTRVLRFRVLNLVAAVVLTGFNVALQIWQLVVMNIVLSAINLWHIRKLVATRHDEAAFDVLEVGPNDEYLRHVLRIHEADILKFQPDLVWDGSAPDAWPSSSSAATRPWEWCWCGTTTAWPRCCSTTSRPGSATSPPASSCGAAARCSANTASAGSSLRLTWSMPTTGESGSSATAKPAPGR